LKGSRANTEEKEKKSAYWAGPGKLILVQKERGWNWAAEFVFFLNLDSSQADLNIFKPNLNWIQNRIKSNQLFGTFSNLGIDLNNQI
jgi:hypothetical protein